MIVYNYLQSTDRSDIINLKERIKGINQVNINQHINIILAEPDMPHIYAKHEKNLNLIVQSNIFIFKTSAFIFLPAVYILTMQRSVEKDQLK